MATENYIRDLQEYDISFLDKIDRYQLFSISLLSQSASVSLTMNFANLFRYLTSGNLSDFALNFGDKTWKAHKTIVCCHSKWFRNAVINGFEVSNRNSKQHLNPN